MERQFKVRPLLGLLIRLNKRKDNFHISECEGAIQKRQLKALVLSSAFIYLSHRHCISFSFLFSTSSLRISMNITFLSWLILYAWSNYCKGPINILWSFLINSNVFPNARNSPQFYLNQAISNFFHNGMKIKFMKE